MIRKYNDDKDKAYNAQRVDTTRAIFKKIFKKVS